MVRYGGGFESKKNGALVSGRLCGPEVVCVVPESWSRILGEQRRDMKRWSGPSFCERDNQGHKAATAS